MRSVPPPLCNIELRDCLSELLNEAFSEPDRAVPLYALRSFGRLAKAEQRVAIRYDALIGAVVDAVRDLESSAFAAQGIDALIGAGLLQRHGEAAGERWIAASEALQGELRPVSSRVEAYCRVLETFRGHPIRPVGLLERAMSQAACLFNEGLFFEVHEVLEAVWLKAEGQVRLALQGLIQIAAGFHHLENGNLKGALNLLEEGRQKLKDYGETFAGLELRQFIQQVRACHRSIEALGSGAFDRFDRRMIPKMRLLS
jgi:predicted metal-dependent hydrolase